MGEVLFCPLLYSYGICFILPVSAENGRKRQMKKKGRSSILSVSKIMEKIEGGNLEEVLFCLCLKYYVRKYLERSSLGITSSAAWAISSVMTLCLLS